MFSCFDDDSGWGGWGDQYLNCVLDLWFFVLVHCLLMAVRCRILVSQNYGFYSCQPCVFLIFNVLMMTVVGGSLLGLRFGPVLLCFSTLPIDGSSVPKHVGVGTYHYLHFMICILLYFVMCIY